ncbi:uncharacterized protein G2W53_041414 [Senna tora]|uniref:Ubiquitin-like protease family profile domain-containing protein n=1 Tax=Senna tora TaxID=362788 RepID=A0A834SHD7_9FABA|nr:uncharacterized protein G2W53_041414 [Senna tora]
MIAHVEEEKIYVLDTLQHDKHYYTTVKEFVVLGFVINELINKNCKRAYHLVKNGPRQPDRDNCGLLMLKIMQCWTMGRLPSFSLKEHTSIITKSFVGVKDDYLAESNDFVSYLKKLVAANNAQEYIKNNHFDELDTQNVEERNYYKDAAKEFK